MPKRVKPLSATHLTNAKPKDKEYKLSDGGGLYFVVPVYKSKWWRFDYTFEDKRLTLSLGTYPTLSLENARVKRDEAKSLLSQGINPSTQKKQDKQAIRDKKELEKINDNSQIHKVVNQWLNHISDTLSPITLKKETSRINNHFLKHFATYNQEDFITYSKPISEIKRADIIKILSELSETKQETADRIFGYLNRIWLYAINHEYIENNIIANISKKDTLKRNEVKHYPKITDEATLKELLNAIDNYDRSVIVKQALKLVSHLPLRADTLTSLKWEFIDFDKKLLTIPRNQMKVKNKNLPDFALPLTSQVIEILQDTKNLFYNPMYVFPSPYDFNRPISQAGVSKGLINMGFDDEINNHKQTLHSFRGTYSSLAYQYQNIHKATDTVIEAVLDHYTGGAVQLAYNHKADYTNQMKPLLEWWSGYLDEIKNKKERVKK